jgi:hypothetical protein
MEVKREDIYIYMYVYVDRTKSRYMLRLKERRWKERKEYQAASKAAAVLE